jgi:hypothetical protein
MWIPGHLWRSILEGKVTTTEIRKNRRRTTGLGGNFIVHNVSLENQGKAGIGELEGSMVPLIRYSQKTLIHTALDAT